MIRTDHTVMPAIPPRNQFQHHGVEAETREAWEARQRAEAVERARVELEARRRAALEAEQAAEAARRMAAMQLALQAQARAVEQQKIDSNAASAQAASAAQAQRAADRAPVTVPTRPASLRSANAGPRRLAAFGATAIAVTSLVLWFSTSTSRGRAEESPPSAAGESAPSAAPTTAPASGAGPASARSSAPTRSFAAAPTIDPEPSGWWCICYKTIRGDDQTACRRSHAQCEELRSMVQKTGSQSIAQGSASPDQCTHIPGPYPWQRLGHAEQWARSAHSDAANASREIQERRRSTQAPGICALPR